MNEQVGSPSIRASQGSSPAIESYFNLLARSLTASLYPESSYQMLSLRTDNSLKSQVVNRIIKFFGQRNMAIYHLNRMDDQKRAEGVDWPSFGYSMIGLKRLANIRECVEEVVAQQIPGDLVECGVWRGGALMMMRAVLDIYGETNRTVYGFDSFEGMPKPNYEAFPHEERVDLSGMPYLIATEEDVRMNFSRMGIPMDGVKLIKGWFKDSLPKADVDRISVLRLDGDHYESTIQILENLYPKVSPGGYVIVDDYNSWEACKRAVHDYLSREDISVDIKKIDSHGVFWRA